jgi:flagellar basal body-associated protein FliL
LVRIIPQKPTFREKLWVRILIIIIVFVLLTGVVSFWYWFFNVRSQPPVEEKGPEDQVPLGDVVIPETLFPVDSIKVVLISGPEEVPQLLSQALEEQADQGKFKRVIVKTKSRVLNLKEFFQSLLIEMPEDFYLRIAQDFTLFIYPQSQGNRLGLVTKVLDKPGLEGFFALRETTLEHDLDGFFELQGKDEPGIVSYFRNASDVSGYSGPNFRYQTLTTSDLGICYFVSDDYFVLTSSWNSMEKVLKKLTTN